MNVVFVAPNDSDDEDLSNCEGDNHLKYKFITNETEHNRRIKQNDFESNHRTKDLTASNGNGRKSVLEQADTASIDSNQR
jgi:hypothetical protein